MLHIIYFLFMQVFQVNASGISDKNMEISYQKAQFNFNKEIQIQIKAKNIPDSLEKYTKDFGLSFFKINQFLDSIKSEPPIVEFITTIKWTYNNFAETEKTILIENKNSIPYWVKNNTIQNMDNFYYGIGVSDSSKQHAQNLALINFAENVETKVYSLYKSESEEQNNEFVSHKESVQEIKTDITLSGIPIKETYELNDSEKIKYYVLYEINKDDYEKELLRLINRRYQQKITELKNASELESTLSKVKQSSAINSSIDIETEKKIKENNEKKFQLLYETYKDFIEIPSRPWQISFMNGEFSDKHVYISARTDIKNANQWQYNFTLNYYIIEAFHRFKQNEANLFQPEYGFRFQLLKRSGIFNKISLSVGYLFYSDTIFQNKEFSKNIGKIDKERSLFINGNMLIPEVFHSIASMYLDKKQMSLSWESYLLYNAFKTDLSFIGELHLFFDNKYSNKYNDSFFFNFGIKFFLNSHASTTIAYQDNHLFSFNVNLGF